MSDHELGQGGAHSCGDATTGRQAGRLPLHHIQADICSRMIHGAVLRWLRQNVYILKQAHAVDCINVRLCLPRAVHLHSCMSVSHTARSCCQVIGEQLDVDQVIGEAWRREDV